MKNITLPFLLLISIYCFSQQNNYIDNIQIYPSLCGSNNGEINFTQNCSHCTYSWEDSEESGNRLNLDGGTYYLNVNNV